MVDNRYDGRLPEPPYECPSCTELADIKESYRNVVEGKCAGDEKHCACVPALREELERVRAKHQDVEGMAEYLWKEDIVALMSDAKVVARAVSARLEVNNA